MAKEKTDIRDRIGRYIEDRGFSKSIMAARAGMKPTILCAIIHKRRKLEANELLRLCDAMGVTAEEMRYYEGEK